MRKIKIEDLKRELENQMKNKIVNNKDITSPIDNNGDFDRNERTRKEKI